MTNYAKTIGEPGMYSKCPLTQMPCDGNCMWSISNSHNHSELCAITVIAMNIGDAIE